MEQHVLAWIAQYGYLAIFSLLVLGIVGLPVPDETLLTFTGYLVFRGHLSPPLAFLSAFAGSTCGITLSYTLGRTFGIALIHRYGRYLRITGDRVEKAHAWFRRAGHWSLTIGYFIPGVRHFTAYAAGMSELEYPTFALFAYAGALVEDCVIMDNCDIGRRAKVRGAILDKNVKVPEDALIGYDLEADRARGYHITESGLVVISGMRSHVEISGLVV